MNLRAYFDQLELESVADDFDLDLVGFDCAGELFSELMESGNSRTCPFRVPCGRVRGHACEMEKRRRLLSHGTLTRQ